MGMTPGSARWSSSTMFELLSFVILLLQVLDLDLHNNMNENDSVSATKLSQDGYVKTASHNYVSRQSFIHGAKNVEMKGKSIIHPNAHIRGDLTSIRIGRYCSIGENTIIRPPSYQTSLIQNSNNNNNENQLQFLPSLIGNHTRIGKDCIIESASIGSSVYIDDNCVISKRVIIKDCCYVESGTVIAPDTVIPPFSRVGGCPGKILEALEFSSSTFLPESVAVTFVDDCVDNFSKFVKELEEE